MSTPEETARTDWANRIGRASGRPAAAGAPRLAPPVGLRATGGRGQVTLDWQPVPGAIGYQVYVADGATGEFGPLDHSGRDVLAVPHPPYVDTTGEPGRERSYAVAALSDIAVEGPVSARVAATPAGGGEGRVRIEVDARADLGELPRPWRPMIGSEHVSHLLEPGTTGGRPIGAELSSALRAAHRDLGVAAVRAHGILCDDLGTYREAGGEPVHDFSGIDRVYDHLLSLGLTPVVELSFMPRDLASDPSATVFAYNAIVSPPKDWQRWEDLVRALVQHLTDRYGLDEVCDRWAFEVWNEPNLEVFWSGTPAEYLRLYDVTARAVKSVDPRLRVGGPASAAAGWIEELLAHVDASGAPLDFVSTHTYGSPPLDLRPALERHGRSGTQLWWTEWGVTPTHFNEVSDAVFSGAFLLRGMASALERIDALSYWVVSDHFEELGRPSSLFHGGFGMRTVGGLRKPRWWAIALLERLGGTRLDAVLDGDGGGSLVESLAARSDDGRVGVLVWNTTLDQTKAAGCTQLARTVSVRIRGLSAGQPYELTHHRVDAGHSNVAGVWARLRAEGQDWPDDAQWAALHAADRLEELTPAHTETADADGVLTVEFELPMPGFSLVEVAPRH